MSLWTRLTRALLSPALDGPPDLPPPDHAPPRPFPRPPHSSAPRHHEAVRQAPPRRPPQFPKAARTSRPSHPAAPLHPPQAPQSSAATLDPLHSQSHQPPPPPPETAPAAPRRRAFRPTSKQRALAEAACGLALPLRTNQLCSRAHVSPRSFYRWQRQPGFSAWFAAAALQALATATPLLILSAMQSAIDGDPAARKLMFQYCVSPDLSPAIASQLAGMYPAGEYDDGPAQPLEEPAPHRRRPRPAAAPAATSSSQPKPGRASPIRPAYQGRPPRILGRRAKGGASPPSLPSPPSDPPNSPQPPASPSAAPPESPFPPGIAPMWRVNEEGKLEPVPLADW